MPTLTETPHAGGFLVWETLRDYCRSTVVLASGNLQPGTILGKITASGKYTEYSTALGHLFHAHVASHSMTCCHPREVICEATYS